MRATFRMTNLRKWAGLALVLIVFPAVIPIFVSIVCSVFVAVVDNDEKNIGARNRAGVVILRPFDNFTYRRGILGVVAFYRVLIWLCGAYAPTC